MYSEPTGDSSKQPARGEPWRIKRLVFRAQPHLNEIVTGPMPQRILLAGVVVLMVVAALMLFFWIEAATKTSAKATPTLVPSPAAPTRTLAAPTAAPAASTPVPTQVRPPTPPPSAVPTKAPAATSVKHRVKAGDTLTSLSAKYDVSVQSIMKANNLKNDTIRIGDELTIPLPTRTPH